jgi:hypothetical protein
MRLIIVALLIVVSGCATTSKKMNKLSLGMTKEQVMKIMGEPTSASATDGVEYMNYTLYESGTANQLGIGTPYFVRIKGGAVESFGRAGDFDSTKTNTIRVEQVQKKD